VLVKCFLHWRWALRSGRLHRLYSQAYGCSPRVHLLRMVCVAGLFLRRASGALARRSMKRKSVAHWRHLRSLRSARAHVLSKDPAPLFFAVRMFVTSIGGLAIFVMC